MDLSLIGAEGGWQEFELQGRRVGGPAALGRCRAAGDRRRLLPRPVGARRRPGHAEDAARSPRRSRKARSAYLKRQFRTIAVILDPARGRRVRHVDGDRQARRHRGAVVRPVGRCSARWRSCSAAWRPALTGYIGMTLATRGNVRTAAAAKTGSMADALTVAFRTGGVAGMFTVGLGLLGATVIIMLFQNTSVGDPRSASASAARCSPCSCASAAASSPRPPTSAPTSSARSRRASPRTTPATRPPSPTTSATTSATAPAWPPTCSRATRSPSSPRSSSASPPSTRSAPTRRSASSSRSPPAPSASSPRSSASSP